MSKKIGLGFLAVVAFAVIGLSAGHANAAAAWYTCTVVKAGPAGSSSVYVYLTDTSTSKVFTKKAFTCRSGQENRQLATALAAITNGQKVYVNVDPTITAQASRIINSMYLVAD